MAQRNYSATAAPTTLTGSGLGSNASTDVTAAVASVSGYPTPPFTAAIERGTPSEECVLVTASAGATSWTVQRGYDGTSVVAHPNGARFEHCVAAVDYREANLHVNSIGAGVHGVTGNLVGDTDVQTLANKTLTAPALNGIVNLLGSSGAPIDSRFVGAVNGAAPTGGPYSVGDWAIDIGDANFWFCTTAGSPGSWTKTVGNQVVTYPGRTHPMVKAGTASLTTDGNGYTYLTHNAGVTPLYVGIEPYSPGSGNTIPMQHVTVTITSTQATTRWLNQTGVVLANVAIVFRWFVIYEAG